MKRLLFNKRGGVDSLFTWIISFGVIIFIMACFIFFTLLLFGKQQFSGGNALSVVGVTPIEKNMFFLLESPFIIDGKKMRVIDGIYHNIDLFALITNEEGKTFLEIFGVQQPSSQLQREMNKEGFDEDDWDNLIEAHREFKEGNVVASIQKKLNMYCDEYYLSIPLGIITRDGLKNKNEVDFHNDDASIDRYITQSYPLVSGKYHFTILFRTRKECLHE